MTRTDRTTWQRCVDAWLSGLLRESTKERAVEHRQAALTRKLDADHDEAIRPLGSTRFLSIGISARAGAAQPLLALLALAG